MPDYQSRPVCVWSLRSKIDICDLGGMSLDANVVWGVSVMSLQLYPGPWGDRGRLWPTPHTLFQPLPSSRGLRSSKQNSDSGLKWRQPVWFYLTNSLRGTKVFSVTENISTCYVKQTILFSHLLLWVKILMNKKYGNKKKKSNVRCRSQFYVSKCPLIKNESSA